MTIPARMKDRLSDESGFGLVETLIAITILVIGLVAVSGLSLASADQALIANWRSQQASAAQIVLEGIERDGWWGAASGVDTVSVAGHEIPVKVAVSSVTKRVRQVTIVVAGVGEADTVIYRTRLYKPLPLPDPPPGP
ncbi:MAG: prepilin-type N-terminal cleavage/methylation domain-containing protein [Gemmatimonadetes bacterium]|nr:prepilin-type N-terminal cleavage/methylation domain-containing protein [Gemmatimonadota bacterium]